MGLTVAYTIIKNHGGHMTVESELGRGTTISFYLPAAYPLVNACLYHRRSSHSWEG